MYYITCTLCVSIIPNVQVIQSQSGFSNSNYLKIVKLIHMISSGVDLTGSYKNLKSLKIKLKVPIKKMLIRFLNNKLIYNFSIRQLWALIL